MSSMITLKPRDLATFLTAAIPARRKVLITGAPGIGKSDIVAQACHATQADLILSHPAVADPTDAKGLPWVINGEATFLPFGDLQQAISAEKPTVWFLDDLGQATPAVQASYMQLLLARRVNGHALSDHVTFVAATNRRVDRAGVTGILEPVKSRFHSIVELEPDLDDWCNWAMSREVPPELIAFLRFRSELLCKFSASADLVNSPLPRTWAHVAELLSLGLQGHVLNAAVAGAVGEGAAVEFLAFLKMFLALPNIERMIDDPMGADIPDAPNVLYAIVTALAAKTTDKNYAQIAKYTTRLLDAGHGEFGVLLTRDAMRRVPAIVQTAAFVKLATGEFGQLVSGRSV